MTRQNRVKENEGSRTSPLFSLPCVVHRLFVSWQPLCVAIDGVVLAETRCRPCLLLVFTPCAPLSVCLFALGSLRVLMLPLSPCLSCQTCILCAPALPPVSVMRAALVVVLFPACNSVACCTCFCRRHVPALASVLCLTPVGVLIPVSSPSRTLFPFAGQAGRTPLCVLGVTWRRHVSPSPAMLATWRVNPFL